MTNVSVNLYTHSVTYVADNILKSFKDIIRLSGLDPSGLVNTWPSKMLALETWLNSGHLERVVLEIYDPKTNALITRWDVDIVYAWSGDAGHFWTDTEQLKYAIKKAGVSPSEAKYDLILSHKAGAPDVPGWSSVNYRSTNSMVRQSLGSTVEHNGLAANTAYWRKVGS
jgi:hypothetical protein